VIFKRLMSNGKFTNAMNSLQVVYERRKEVCEEIKVAKKSKLMCAEWKSQWVVCFLPRVEGVPSLFMSGRDGGVILQHNFLLSRNWQSPL
jgi:hypothetical protein